MPTLPANCPTTNSSVPKAESIIDRIDKLYRYTSKSLIVYSAIILLLMIILGYCIYNIITIVQFYYSQRASVRESTAAKKNASNNPMNPGDDNEMYINHMDSMNAENSDDYVKFTEQINKSIQEFKTYNQQLKNYYRENRPGEQPADMIDKSIFDKDADNY